MNATDFIRLAEYKELKELADKQQRFRHEREVKINGNRYSVTIRSFFTFEGDYKVGLNVFRDVKSETLTDGRAKWGSSDWFADFSSYDAVKEQINFYFKKCPDFEESEQIMLF